MTAETTQWSLSHVWEALRKTWSTKPYSLASSALNQRSRSESFSICSTV